MRYWNKKKHINKRYENGYSVEIIKEKIKRRIVVSSFEEASILRDKWLEEYFNNPEQWIKETINKTYKRE